MDENAEAIAIEHQPRKDLRDLVVSEFHLIHRLWMRANGVIDDAAEGDLEPRPDRIAQRLGDVAGLRVEIDVRVITADLLSVAHGHHAGSASTTLTGEAVGTTRDRRNPAFASSVPYS